MLFASSDAYHLQIPKLAVMIPLISTFIILHISFDPLLFFLLRVNHYLDCGLLSIFAIHMILQCAVAACLLSVFHCFPSSFVLSINHIQVPFLLPEDNPSDIRPPFANRHIPSF
jgi:hypothetical protein